MLGALCICMWCKFPSGTSTGRPRMRLICGDVEIRGVSRPARRDPARDWAIGFEIRAELGISRAPFSHSETTSLDNGRIVWTGLITSYM